MERLQPHGKRTSPRISTPAGPAGNAWVRSKPLFRVLCAPGTISSTNLCLQAPAPGLCFARGLPKLLRERRSAAVVWRLAPAAGVFFSVLAVIAIIFGTTVNAEGPKPKAGLTPGETRPITIDEICRNPQAEVITVNIPEETRRKVFSEYGIDARADNFEVDYLITPDLGRRAVDPQSLAAAV